MQVSNSWGHLKTLFVLVFFQGTFYILNILLFFSFQNFSLAVPLASEEEEQKKTWFISRIRISWEIHLPLTSKLAVAYTPNGLRA